MAAAATPLTRKQQIRQGLLVAAIGVCGVVSSSLVSAWLSSSLEAPKLRKQVESLRDDLNKKTADLQKLETEFVPYRTIALQYFSGTEAERMAKLALKLQEVQLVLHTLSEKQKLTGEKTAGIEKRLSQRSLSSEQETKLLRELIPVEKIEIGISYGDDNREVITFKNQIERILRKAGFRFSSPFSISHLAGRTLETPSPWNLAIVFKEGEGFLPVQGLQRAFTEIGVELRVYRDSAKIFTESVAPGTPPIQIFVGSK